MAGNYTHDACVAAEAEETGLTRIVTAALPEFTESQKRHVLLASTFCTLNCVMGSSLPSGGTKEIIHDFGITSSTESVLLVSLYLAGFAIGPLIWGPLSEQVGRRPVLTWTFFGYVFSTLACALAPSYNSLLVFRAFAGVSASAPNAVIAGLYADVYLDPKIRGEKMAWCLYSTTLGPDIGPMLSSWVSPINWRYTFWMAFGMALLCWPSLALMPETFAPVRARKIEKAVQLEHANMPTEFAVLARIKTIRPNWGTIFLRPAHMFFSELIVLYTCLYLALTYGTLYLFFQAYPIIFQDLYGLQPRIATLAFIPLMVGATIAMGMYLWYSRLLEKAQIRGAAWSHKEEYRRLPLACVGGIFLIIGLFWLGWTSNLAIHPVVPMLSGISFNIGYMLIFLAMLNYLTDAYKTFSASAQAASSTTRAIVAVCLPLATSPMYGNLGIRWATSLLGICACAMAVIPFAFIWYSDSIRAGSKLLS